jgi:hypothetical protein
MLERRDFLKQSAMLATGFFLGRSSIFSEQDAESNAEFNALEQRVIINLPAYELTLTNFQNEKAVEAHTFTVSIGRGAEGRKPTPAGEGFIYEKRKRIILRYGDNFPQYNKKRGDLISWNNTFDEAGKPFGRRLDYGELRGLGMKIKSENFNYYDMSNVMHSTLDDFTVGTPSSHGCVGVTKKDMLRLFGLVAPNVEDGKLKRPVNLKITYELVELKGDNLLIHGNVYNKNMDCVEELKAKMLMIHPEAWLDMDKIKKEFDDASKEFQEAHKQILEKLLKGWPNNYISPELKQKLHRTYKLADLAMKES